MDGKTLYTALSSRLPPELSILVETWEGLTEEHHEYWERAAEYVNEYAEAQVRLAQDIG